MHVCNRDTGHINCGNANKIVARICVLCFVNRIVLFFMCFWLFWDLCCLPCSSFLYYIIRDVVVSVELFETCCAFTYGSI